MLCILFLAACSEDEVPEVPGNNTPGISCDGVEVSFSNDIVPLFNTACALSGCHVAGGNGNGNFESYEGIKAKADNGSLVSRAVVQGNMPPSNSSGPRSLTEAQKIMIQCWVEGGAMNN